MGPVCIQYISTLVHIIRIQVYLDYLKYMGVYTIHKYISTYQNTSLPGCILYNTLVHWYISTYQNKSLSGLSEIHGSGVYTIH